MNKKKFFVACISCCNAFLGLFFFAIAGPLTVICAEDDMPKETPVLETTGVELLATRLGKLDVTVKASQMRQYESGNIELTGGITVVVFGDPSDQGEGPTHIQANSLFYNKAEALCTIAGGVVVTKPESELEIKTEQLCYDIKKEVIFTEIPVVIVHKDLTLKGDALRATKDLTKYTITGPSGSVDIQQEAVLEANRL